MIGRRMPYYVKRGIGGIDANTVLMLHGEDFTDSSLTPKAISNSGVTVDSSGKFGSCLSFGGSQRLSINNNNDFNFGTGNFTIDFWMRISFAWTDSAQHGAIAGQKESDNSYGWQLYRDGPTTGIDARLTLQNNFFSSIPTIGVWEHWALVRYNGTLKWYKNGVLDATGSNTTNIYDTSSPFYIGYAPTWSYYFNGKLDELRISNVARWTSDFTPPTQPYDEG